MTGTLLIIHWVGETLYSFSLEIRGLHSEGAGEPYLHISDRWPPVTCDSLVWLASILRWEGPIRVPNTGLPIRHMEQMSVNKVVRRDCVPLWTWHLYHITLNCRCGCLWVVNCEGTDPGAKCGVVWDSSTHVVTISGPFVDAPACLWERGGGGVFLSACLYFLLREGAGPLLALQGNDCTHVFRSH